MIEKKVFLLRNLSCSGGTFITSVLTARNDTALINEFHAFEKTPKNFTPNSLIGNLLNSMSFINRDEVLDYRISEINELKIENFNFEHNKLFIRWHSYCDYLTDEIDYLNREINFQKFCSETKCEVLTIIRDSLTSYTSNVIEGFIQMSLGNFLQRYEVFFNEIANKNIFKYQDFCVNPKQFEEVSLKLFGSWNQTQLNSLNWKSIAGSRFLEEKDWGEANLATLEDARSILGDFQFSELEENLEKLEQVTLMAEYETNRSRNHLYAPNMKSRISNTSLFRTQERDALTQERDALYGSISWRITRPIGKIPEISKVLYD